jgi:hypothetical protein
MNSGQSERNFKDSKSFMIKEDGRIAFCTQRETWLDIVKHGLPLDDYFFFQTHSPTISFDFKPRFFRYKKEKEGLNDEDRCESCNQPFDTITFQRKNKDCKEAVCSSCAYSSRLDCLERSFNLKDLNNHLVKVETLLYHLSYSPSDYRVSAKWILPLLIVVIYNWTTGTGMYKINTLRNISSSWWHIDDFDLINVTDVVTILREIRDEIKVNMNSLS